MSSNRLYRHTLNGDGLHEPATARFNLVRRHHDDVGHPGYVRCPKLVKETYWFPSMGRYIRKYVDTCLRCAFCRGAYRRVEGTLHPIIKLSVSFDIVHVDHR